LNKVKKNRIIVDLLKWVDISLWTAENETFNDYPIQFCVKPDDFLRLKELLDEYDIVYDMLNFNRAIDDCIIIDIMSNVYITNNISDDLSVVVLNVNRDNHSKFLSLFCD